MAIRAIPTHRHLSRGRPMAPIRRPFRSLRSTAPSTPTSRRAWEPGTDNTLPGSVCSTCTPPAVTPSHTWTGRDLGDLVERLGGAIVVGSGQGAAITLTVVRFLKEDGKLNLLKGVIIPEGPTVLASAGLSG